MSYAGQSYQAPTNSSNALFRSWGSDISSKLSLMGQVQTGDSGQINWTTVSAPTGANNYPGYEVWRFNDSLQATKPVYYRLDYGAGGATNTPSVRLSVGTGSNGSGTVTGQLATVLTSQLATNSTTYFPCYYSGDTNRVGVAQFNSGSLQVNHAFYIERSKDTIGADDGIAILLHGFSAQSSRFIQYIPHTGAIPASLSSSNILVPKGTTIGSGNVNSAYAQLYPNPHIVSGLYKAYGITHMGAFANDMLTGQTGQGIIYGVRRTYLYLGSIGSGGAFGKTTTPAVTLAMLYE